MKPCDVGGRKTKSQMEKVQKNPLTKVSKARLVSSPCCVSGGVSAQMTVRSDRWGDRGIERGEERESERERKESTETYNGQTWLYINIIRPGAA